MVLQQGVVLLAHTGTAPPEQIPSGPTLGADAFHCSQESTSTSTSIRRIKPATGSAATGLVPEKSRPPAHPSRKKKESLALAPVASAPHQASTPSYSSPKVRPSSASSPSSSVPSQRHTTRSSQKHKSRGGIRKKSNHLIDRTTTTENQVRVKPSHGPLTSVSTHDHSLDKNAHRPSPGAFQVQGDVSPAIPLRPEPDDIGAQEPIHVEDTDQLVAAELAPDDDEENVAARVAERLERQITNVVEAKMLTNRQSHILVEAVEKSSEICGLPKKAWGLILLILTLAIGGMVAGVILSSENGGNASVNGTAPTATSPSSPKATPSLSNTNGKLQDIQQWLEPWIPRTETDLIPFDDPNSPQSLALEWMITDPISLGEKGSTKVLLERYVLAVLYFSTDGPDWNLEHVPYMTASNTCNWNNNLTFMDSNVRGILCDGSSNVQHIYLQEVGLTGILPWELSLLSDLLTLSLNENDLRGTLPTEIAELSNLQYLFLRSNELTGSLPISLPSRIQYVNFLENHFYGRLPSEWGDSLFNLMEIFLGKNDLSGPLPSEIAKLTTLKVFAINNNNFTGQMPSELGQLTALERLTTSYNNFIGQVPSELGKLVTLQYFWISNNNLTGTVPTELAQLTNLKEISIDRNFLTGSVNNIWCGSAINDSTFIQSDCLVGGDGQVEIECSCCTNCWY